MKFTSTTPPSISILSADMRTGRAIRRMAMLSSLAVLVAVLAASGLQLDRAATAVTRPDEPVYLPRAEYLRPMSLGWQNAFADVLWFRTISYFGEHYRNDRTYRWLADMCDLVTDLDPRAEHVYRFCGGVLPWEAGEVDAGMHVLEKGVRQFPESWTLQYSLGFLEYFFKDDRARALAYLRRAAQLPGAHPEVAHLAALLTTEQYGPETTLELLSELERDTDSADLREVLRDRMLDAQADINVQRLNAAVAVYAERTGRTPLLVDDLVTVGLLAEVPTDPFGGTYVIDPLAAIVRSSTGREPSRLHDSPVRQKVRRGESVRDA
jgi:hypothetical protein